MSALFDVVDVIPECAYPVGHIRRPSSKFVYCLTWPSSIIIDNCNFDSHGGLLNAMRACGRVDSSGYLLDTKGQRVSTILSKAYELNPTASVTTTMTNELKQKIDVLTAQVANLEASLNSGIHNCEISILNLKNDLRSETHNREMAAQNAKSDLKADTLRIGSDTTNLKEAHKALNAKIDQQAEKLISTDNLNQQNARSLTDLTAQITQLQTTVAKLSGKSASPEPMKKFICSVFEPANLQDQALELYGKLCPNGHDEL